MYGHKKDDVRKIYNDFATGVGSMREFFPSDGFTSVDRWFNDYDGNDSAQTRFNNEPVYPGAVFRRERIQYGSNVAKMYDELAEAQDELSALYDGEEAPSAEDVQTARDKIEEIKKRIPATASNGSAIYTLYSKNEG